MENQIEKFMNENFIVNHGVEHGIHHVTTYDRKNKKIINTYAVNDAKYAYLRFIQSVMNLI